MGCSSVIGRAEGFLVLLSVFLAWFKLSGVLVIPWTSVALPVLVPFLVMVVLPLLLCVLLCVLLWVVVAVGALLFLCLIGVWSGLQIVGAGLIDVYLFMSGSSR